MPPASDLDGIDFKPFFDMIVGILFILLILIGSLLFFQTADKNASTAKDEQTHVDEWQAQEMAFLDSVVRDLRARGLDAAVDRVNRAIVLPLGQLAVLGANGLPDIMPKPASDLSGILARDLACVTPSSDHAGGCADFPLLRLNNVVASVRTGGLAAGAILAPERSGILIGQELSVALAKGSPELVGLSRADGTQLWKVTTALGAAKPGPLETVGGDMTMSLEFVAP